MTPLMIGIIVAASVVAVLFVVMAAVVPTFNREVNMQVRPRSVKGNSTADDFALKFNVMCDYAAGEVWRVEIFKGGEQIGYVNTPTEDPFEKYEERTMIVNSFTYVGTNSSDVQAGKVLFLNGEEYIIRILFRPVDSDITTLYSDYTFIYASATN